MVLEMYALLFRLALRLGAPHPIPIKYNALIDAWAELINTLEIVLDRNRNNEERAASEGAEENAERCQSDLMTECEAWLR